MWYNNLMSTITVQDLERDPRGLLHRVEAGESFTVVRGDHAVAEVRPAAVKTTEPRPFGLATGQFEVPSDFNAALPDEIFESFEGQ
jgi:antitoxin (DNA-binding transcriptional repressor) of toxin-antitoxin stability system